MLLLSNTLLAGRKRDTNLSLVLRHVGDCSGACVEKVGGGMCCWVRAGSGWYYTKWQSCVGRCVSFNTGRQTDVRPTKPGSSTSGVSLAANYCCGCGSSSRKRSATQRNATAASVVVSVIVSVIVVRSQQCLPARDPPTAHSHTHTHTHTHLHLSLRALSTDPMASCHPPSPPA